MQVWHLTDGDKELERQAWTLVAIKQLHYSGKSAQYAVEEKV